MPTVSPWFLPPPGPTCGASASSVPVPPCASGPVGSSAARIGQWPEPISNTCHHGRTAARPQRHPNHCTGTGGPDQHRALRAHAGLVGAALGPMRACRKGQPPGIPCTRSRGLFCTLLMQSAFACVFSPMKSVSIAALCLSSLSAVAQLQPVKSGLYRWADHPVAVDGDRTSRKIEVLLKAVR